MEHIHPLLNYIHYCSTKGRFFCWVLFLIPKSLENKTKCQVFFPSFPLIEQPLLKCKYGNLLSNFICAQSICHHLVTEKGMVQVIHWSFTQELFLWEYNKRSNLTLVSLFYCQKAQNNFPHYFLTIKVQEFFFFFGHFCLFYILMNR